MPLYTQDKKYYFQDQPGTPARQVDASPGGTYDTRVAQPLPEGVTTFPFGSSYDTGQGPQRVPVPGETSPGVSPGGGLPVLGGAGTPAAPIPPLETDPAKILAGKEKLKSDAYQQELGLAQGEIQRINDYYKRLFEEDVRAGEERMANVRSLSAAGLIAGTAATTKAEEDVRDITAREEEATGQARSAAIAKVYDTVNKNAADMAGEAETQALANRDKIKKDATDSLDTLASQGLNAASILQTDPQLYQNLKNQTGFSDYQLDSYLYSKMPDKFKPVTKDVYYSSPDGKSTIVKRITVNPRTGESSEQDFTIDAPIAAVNPDSLIKGADGGLYAPQAGGLLIDVTPGKAPTSDQTNYRFAQKQGYTGSFIDYIKTQAEAKRVTVEPETRVVRKLRVAAIELARPELEKSKGADGYVNPDVYNTLRSDYAEAIGDAKAFDDVFADQLSPRERQRLGVGKATAGAVAEESRIDWSSYLDTVIEPAGGGFWGFGGRSQNDVDKEKSALLSSIKAMQDAGMTDTQILKELSKPK